jgi:TonB family protein
MRTSLKPAVRPWPRLSLLLAAFCAGVGICAFSQQTEQQPPVDSLCVTDKGKVLHVGYGVSPPRALFTNNRPPEPQEKKKHTYETTILTVIVGSDGAVCDAKLTKSTSKDKEFNAKVIALVRKWKFEPARKDGKPVPVEITVETHFDLY